MPDAKNNKPLMRSLGEFVGYIYKAVKTDPTTKRVVLNRTKQEEKRGPITLRRTTIEEIEIKPDHASRKS